MKSNQIISALARYHEERDYVWLAEAQVGRKGARCDFFAVNPSWKPEAKIFEVKVSRQDFKRDAKWENYLPYCQLFYFACPADLIQVDEVQADAGLVWVLEDGTVQIIKSAKRRVLKAKNLHLMLHRLLFRYMFCGGGRKPVQPLECARLMQQVKQ